MAVDMGLVMTFGATAIGTSFLWYYFIVRSFRKDTHQGEMVMEPAIGPEEEVKEEEVYDPDKEILAGKTYTLALFRSRGSRIEVIDSKEKDGTTFVFFRNIMTREEKVLSEREFKETYSMWKDY